MNKILFVGSLLLIFFIPHDALAQSCNIPSSCAPGEANQCQNVIQPFPCWNGDEGIIINQITADDAGLLGTKKEDTEKNEIETACGAEGHGLKKQVFPLCRDELIMQSPDPSELVKGFWWRMHDHEDDLTYELFTCQEPLVNGNCPNWNRVQSGDIDTSGDNCGYTCSGNDELHAPYGSGDQGCQSSYPDAKYCQDQDRLDWPCAISYDEHVWNTPSCGGQIVTAFKLTFGGENGHVHITDAVWVYDAPSCTIQGMKVPGANFEYASQEVTLKDADGMVLEKTTSQPYFFTNLPADRQYTVEAAGIDLLGSTLCINDINCHSARADNSAYNSGSSRVVVNCPADGYADLWWHYGALITPTPPDTPTPPVQKSCGALCSPVNQIDPTCISNFCNAVGVCADQDPIGCATNGTCVCPFSTPTPTLIPAGGAGHPYCPR